MTKAIEERLTEMFARNLRAFADDDLMDVDIEFANELKAIADRLESGTATEADWIEAIEQMDING